MRVCIVEDQEKIALALKKGLESEGFLVDVFHDGTQAFPHLLVKGSLYDVIVLDIMLPGKTGVEICREVRKARIDTPILMLTALDDVESKVGGLSLGADDYLTKPFEFEELLARIRALLRRPHALVSEQISVAGITLDVREHTVSKKGKKIPLTQKEFLILEFLMRHPNQVIQREQIIAHVWDQAFDSFSNVVDVHIKNLRKKLQKSNENIFETIHGVGYKLRD
jgi:DNA-binding response OmpR family regulator